MTKLTITETKSEGAEKPQVNCKYHSFKPAHNCCACCGVGLCGNCSQAILLGEYYCFHCSMFISESTDSKKWEPVKYATFVLMVLIFVLMGTMILI